MAADFHIDEHYQALIDRLIEEGRYSSASEVIGDGLQLVEEREIVRAAKIEALRVEIQEGFDSGPAVEVDLDELIDRIKSEGRQRLAAENGE
jgi:antitoxin ParD1/3/4